MNDDPEQSHPALEAAAGRVLDVEREMLTEEELEDQRRFLQTLLETHPRFSSWLEEQRPPKDPEIPDRSGMVLKKDRRSLDAAAERAAKKGQR